MGGRAAWVTRGERKRVPPPTATNPPSSSESPKFECDAGPRFGSGSMRRAGGSDPFPRPPPAPPAAAPGVPRRRGVRALREKGSGLGRSLVLRLLLPFFIFFFPWVLLEERGGEEPEPHVERVLAVLGEEVVFSRRRRKKGFFRRWRRGCLPRPLPRSGRPLGRALPPELVLPAAVWGPAPGWGCASARGPLRGSRSFGPPGPVLPPLLRLYIPQAPPGTPLFITATFWF